MNTKRSLILALIVIMVSALGVAAASATAQETCPHTGGWVKVEAPDPSITGTSMFIAAPSGFVIGEVCIKASTQLYWFEPNNTPFGANIGGQHDISHYSYTLVPVETPTPEPVCEDEGAWNYGGELPCVYDVCPNLEGLQESIPEGYVKPGQRCLPKPEPWPTSTPEPVCEDEAALNYGKALPCEYPEPTPTPTPKPCVSERVFVWDNGTCRIRQADGPIGGQTRPFEFDQNAYCGCGTATDEGWLGYWVDSCQDGKEWAFWQTIPPYCGYQSCE